MIAGRAELAGLTPHGLRHAFASVADDLGFTEATIGAMIGHGGSGLAGLRERALRVHGTLEAGTRPEGGFRLRVTVPLPEP